MADLDLDAIRARHALTKRGNDYTREHYGIDKGKFVERIPVEGWTAAHDALNEDVPALLDALEAEREQRDRYEEALCECMDQAWRGDDQEHHEIRDIIRAALGEVGGAGGGGGTKAEQVVVSHDPLPPVPTLRDAIREVAHAFIIEEVGWESDGMYEQAERFTDAVMAALDSKFRGQDLHFGGENPTPTTNREETASNLTSGCATCGGTGTSWSCYVCGPHPTSRPTWCDAGCGSDYWRMMEVPCPVCTEGED